MPLQYDPTTSTLMLDGQEVGKFELVDGVAKATLNLTYECSPDEWVVPISWFDFGLNKLQKYRRQPSDLKIERDEESIAETYDVPRLLTEKIISRAGYIWEFHKTDPDPWPSLLHGHEYEKNLKLDAITGKIYDVATRQRCKRIKDTDLAEIQDILRRSKDFSDKVVALIDNAAR